MKSFDPILLTKQAGIGREEREEKEERKKREEREAERGCHRLSPLEDSWGEGCRGRGAGRGRRRSTWRGRSWPGSGRTSGSVSPSSASSPSPSLPPPSRYSSMIGKCRKKDYILLNSDFYGYSIALFSGTYWPTEIFNKCI